MTAETPLLIRTFHIGQRTLTVTAPRPRAGCVLTMACEWEPDVPPQLSRSEQSQYDAAMREIAIALEREMAP